jgi:hypothetical protein
MIVEACQEQAIRNNLPHMKPRFSTYLGPQSSLVILLDRLGRHRVKNLFRNDQADNHGCDRTRK